MNRLLLILLVSGCAEEQQPEIIYDTGPVVRPLPTQPPDVDQMCINELMPANKHTELEDGSTSDWIELHNPTDERIDLLHWSVTNSLEDPNLFALPPLEVWPHASIVLQADGRPELGATHLPFKLDASGEAFGLFGPDGSAVWVTWESVADDVALYRNTACCKEDNCWSSGFGGTPGAPNTDL